MEVCDVRPRKKVLIGQLGYHDKEAEKEDKNSEITYQQPEHAGCEGGGLGPFCRRLLIVESKSWRELRRASKPSR